MGMMTRPGYTAPGACQCTPGPQGPPGLRGLQGPPGPPGQDADEDRITHRVMGYVDVAIRKAFSNAAEVILPDDALEVFRTLVAGGQRADEALVAAHLLTQTQGLQQGTPRAQSPGDEGASS